jgi:hypothetical protein
MTLKFSPLRTAASVDLPGALERPTAFCSKADVLLATNAVENGIGIVLPIR